MSHLQAMISRLPHLYRDGKHINQLLALSALQLEVWDEDAREVQRAHWFDDALELSEVAALSDVLGMAPEDWQSLHEFRAWVHAFRNARLQEGSVTIDAIKRFTEEYHQAYQRAVNISLPELSDWSDTATAGKPFLDENPLRFQSHHVTQDGGIEPLQKFTVKNAGLDAAPLSLLVIGLAGVDEFVPVIVNIDSGHALVYRGKIRAGQRLWIFPDQEGGVTARLEQEDVSDRLYSVEGVVPGKPWSIEEMQTPASTLSLQVGDNQLWFLPLGHFNENGLDRFLFSLAGEQTEQGRYDDVKFDQALFYQPPAISLYSIWFESQPATFEVHLPNGSLKHAPNKLSDALGDLERLEFSLNDGVGQLAAAGVASQVSMQVMSEEQPLGDFLTAVLPLNVSEVAPVGSGEIVDAGGVFSVTDFENSTFE